MGSRNTKSAKRRQQRVAVDRRRAMRDVLIELGLWDELRKYPFHRRLLDFRGSYASVKLGDDVTPGERATRLLREAEAALREADFNCPELGGYFPTRDYFVLVRPAVSIVRASAKHYPRVQACWNASAERLESLLSIETMVQSTLSACTAVSNATCKFGRIDERLYSSRLDFGARRNTNSAMLFVIHQEQARARKFDREGARRRAFWCGQPFDDGIEWIEWPRDLVGLADGPPLPVYVQSHALDNLYRREARALLAPDTEWLVHDYLWIALLEPKLTPLARQPGRFLVEYRFLQWLIGYLVAEVVDDAVLVETFLFLTMDGTPQGDALRHKLRLRRSDKQFLALDRLETFLNTDLRYDRELIELLEECGCGHLFEIADGFALQRRVTGHAEAIRRHLGLEAARGFDETAFTI